jgi:tRNA 5-methylaminomethyl-2-thiouridine biosynthesis bifunctional protein
MQLRVGPKDADRFAAIAASDLFDPPDMQLLTAEETSAVTGEVSPPGLSMDVARVVDPRSVLAAWRGEVTRARVTAVERAAGSSASWRLRGADGAVLAEADAVCVAAAVASADLVPGLALTPVRGQVSFTPAEPWKVATIFGAYAIPANGGALIGATHDRGETSLEPEPDDRRRNIEAVAGVLPELGRRLASAPLDDWCAIRATTSDYLPLAGLAPGADQGLWILTGLGSRGFCLAPLLAEHVASQMLGAPSPLPRALAGLVDPGRFAARAARRGRPRT